ncbi:hypothetical protein MKW94_012646 [Papaver nudicaule]|uniref:Uncharacterized protein n=1 Tax=Papaver nudicaule TaxID=74823 RepID=A0AA41VYS0_PAPNU|nr:hypothetical protein [Papaver nudicaule]
MDAKFSRRWENLLVLQKRLKSEFSMCKYCAVNNVFLECFLVISDVLFLFEVNKENRAAGVLENHAEGEKYTEHSLRKFVRNKSPEIMPNLNSFFTSPK